MQITKENLTIIIVTIKSKNIIDDCLKSIDPDIKKIIVENSSNREFTESLKEKYRNIQCYLTGKNLGMGAGNNFGIEKSNTRYVMILNPDTILKPDTLSQIFEASKTVDIEMHDHVIIGEIQNCSNGLGFFSFSESGLMG